MSEVRGRPESVAADDFVPGNVPDAADDAAGDGDDVAPDVPGDGESFRGDALGSPRLQGCGEWEGVGHFSCALDDVNPDLHLRAAKPRSHKFTLEGNSEKEPCGAQPGSIGMQWRTRCTCAYCVTGARQLNRVVFQRARPQAIRKPSIAMVNATRAGQLRDMFGARARRASVMKIVVAAITRR